MEAVTDWMAGAWPAKAWLACWSVALSIVDLRTGWLPTPMVLRLLLGLVALTLTGAVVAGTALPVAGVLLGAATFGGLLLAVRLVAGDGLGGGGLRLAVPLGWFLGRSAVGWRDLVHGVALALLVAAVAALVASGIRRRWREPIAFGPWLCLGTLVAGVA